jgi:hypothetical protein
MLQRLIILQEKPIILKKAIDFGLTPPTFDHSKPSIGKTILADKIEKHSIIPFKYNPYNVKSK